MSHSARIFATLLVITSAGVTRADPGEGEKKAAAQALFDEARALTAASRFAEACPKLAESQRLDPSIGTRFYLAECLEHTGALASAWTYYLEVADAASAAGQKERERFASDRAAAIAARLPKLAVTVSVAAAGAPGIEVKRDGIAVGKAQWGAPIPIDLGAHTIEATAPGKRPWSARIEVTREGALTTIAVPALADDAPAPLAVAPLPPPSMPPQRIAGFAVGAAGLLGIGVGAFFGVQAISKKSASDGGGHCDARDLCDPDGLALRREGLAAATRSNVLFAVGGVLLAGGAVLVLTASPAKAQIALSPTGVTIARRW